MSSIVMNGIGIGRVDCDCKAKEPSKAMVQTRKQEN